MNDIKYIYPRGHRPLVLNLKDDPSGQEVFHSRARPEGCIAYFTEEVEGSENIVAIKWAYSVWNPEDKMFRKSKARCLATERLKDHCTTFCSKTERPSKMIADVLRDISRCKIHHWAGYEDVSDSNKVVFVNSPLSGSFRRACQITEQRIRASFEKQEKETKEEAA